MRGKQLEAGAEFSALEPMTGCGLLGALKCVAGMEGVLPMIHGPVSCSSGHRLAMLYAGVEPLLPTTCVEQTQVILGSMDRLQEAMGKAWEKYRPEVLVVLLSCATAMTGEDYQGALSAYRQRTGKQAILLDGSALAGDEVDLCPGVYQALKSALGIETGSEPCVALEGFAKTDYGFSQNLPALEALVRGSLRAEWTPGLFAGSDVFSPGGSYRTARKVPVGLLWDRQSLDSAAPIGVRGSLRFLKWLQAATGVEFLEEARAIFARQEEALRLPAWQLQKRGLRVAVEGAGWYAYALADYLKNDLGCRVLLSVDRAAEGINSGDVCDEFYEDTGRFELVELMKEFETQVAFGSSNVQMDEAWKYIPFFQPVWRVVEPMALLGYDAAVALAQRLLREAVMGS